MATDYELKKALPNKSYNDDGTTTDLLGNEVINPVPEYANKPSLPNKWLNPDGSYSTLLELISGAIDTELFIVVEELPTEGLPNKIYLLVVDDKLIEYCWVNNEWNPIGMVEFDVSQYSTTDQMNAAIAAALNSAKTYTDEQIAGISANPQVFYWNGEIDQTGVDFWNNLIPYNHDSALTVIVGRIDGINYVPSIIYVTPNFLVEKSSSVHVYSYRYDNTFNSSSTSVIGLDVMDYTLVFQEDKQIRAIYSLHRSLQREILDTNNNYSQPYIPQYPGSPATKKYVDDSIATNITNVLGGSY